MTRNEVLSLKVGDVVQFHINGTSWQPRKVVEITAQRVSEYHGKAFVCFYTEFGPTSQISGSCSEGDDTFTLVQAN